MQEIFEKIKERLRKEVIALEDNYGDLVECIPSKVVTEIVNQVAEELSNSEIPNMSKKLTSSNDGWIPCDRKMPETEEPCWITYEDAYGKLHVGQDIYCDYGGWYETEDTAVKAWMYVNTPAPYQPEGENNGK